MDESETPKFTVSQIVLLQKLKQSGLSKDQIIRGLEEMEKLDEVGLGSPGANVSSSTHNGITSVSPPSSCGSGGNHPNPGNSNQTCWTKDSDLQRVSTSPQSPPHVKLNPGLQHHMGHPNPLIFGAQLQNPNQLSLLPPVAQWPNTSQAVAVATAASLLQNGFAHGSHYPGLINQRGLIRSSVSSSTAGSTVVEIDGDKVDISEELEELFRRDQAAVKEDIRKFISERHISQSSIAKATRNAISQSYISQWLAQPQDISGQKKKAMYTWYIIEKRKPPGMANGMSMNSSSSYRCNDMEQDMMTTLMMKAKRGARFTWPKECLSILENYYNANSYPDESKREEIAHACNAIIQSQKPGGVMSDLDKVTTVKVYNWFANRRKDDKRRRHIEHIEAMDQQQQNILSPRRSSTVSPSPSCNSNDSNSVLDNTSSIQDRPTMVMPKKESVPMSLALEMAAVNHSILALVNQHNGGSQQQQQQQQQQQEETRDQDDEDMDNDSAFDRSQDGHSSDGVPHEAHRSRFQLQQNSMERRAECGSYAA